MAKDTTDGTAASPEGEEAFEVSPEVVAMAAGCFDGADEAARRNNYDYAIELYLQGLRYTPDDVERGHKPLFETALRRKAAGKHKGFAARTARMKFSMLQMAGKKKEAFLELEKAMTGSPDSHADLAALAQMSFNLDLKETPVFFAEQAMEFARRAGKLTESLCSQMADIYEARGYYRAAMNCLQEAEKLDKSSSGKYMKHIRDLAARTTIDQGLEDAGGFHDRLKDKDTARESATQKVRTAEDEFVERAEALAAQLAQNPTDLNLTVTIGDTYARAMKDDLAMQYYRKARAASGGADYRIKVKMDDLRIRQFRLQMRALDETLRQKPDDEEAKKTLQQVTESRNRFELEIFQERAREYPTDMGVRYELGLRHYRFSQIGEAIAAFQLSTRDPKHKIVSLNMLGKCFFNRRLYQEAAKQFQTAIEGYELAGDNTWKELRYNLGLTYEAMKKLDKAAECYSDIVMVDFQYRDAAKRLQELRTRMEGGSAPTEEGGPTLGEDGGIS